jgi:hypothetical protein
MLLAFQMVMGSPSSRSLICVVCKISRTDCEMLRLPADSSTMKRSPGFLVDDHLAEGTDLVEPGIGAGVGQEHQPGIEFDGDAVRHGRAWCSTGAGMPASRATWMP